MTSDQARQQAEKFKEERARDGREAMTEYEAEARATREKTAHLKALRLEREAQAAKANNSSLNFKPPPPITTDRYPA